MNDKEKLLRDYARMCIRGKCDECRIGEKCNFNCGEWIAENPKEATQTIEQWGAEHPVKTRQDEILKLYPNAPTCNGIILIPPCKVNAELPAMGMCDHMKSCECCREEYWLQEVADEIQKETSSN